MPSTYAHYRMGVALLPTFPADIRRTIQRFRRLFDVGLHGPDIFFHYNPIFPNAVRALGSKFHQQTGREFFMRLCRVARLENSEAAQAYIYGALCHYALDSVCHPFIEEQAAVSHATHSEIETEFDRFLLDLDGKRPPESQNLSPHLRLTPGECETVAKFYPPATPRQIQDSLRNMAGQIKLLATPDGARRKALEKSMALLGPHVRGQLMTIGPNRKCCQLNQPLLEKYDRAVAEFPELFNQIQAHITYNGILGEEFTKIFG